MEKKLKALENRIGYEFRNRNLLILALTHSSYANEKKLGKAGCNERLEFLGDAVLELISSDFLYKKFTQIPEGELTKKRASLVCEPSLAYCARDFGLPLGAIYLDGGFASAKEFVLKFILNDLENKQLFYDSKTILQEIVQEKGTHLVEYHLIKEEGPDHNKSFTVDVLVSGHVMGTGVGHTKKAAEQEAAYQAIRKMRK